MLLDLVPWILDTLVDDNVGALSKVVSTERDATSDLVM